MKKHILKIEMAAKFSWSNLNLMNTNIVKVKFSMCIQLFKLQKPKNKFKDEMIEEKQDYNVTFLIFVSY